MIIVFDLGTSRLKVSAFSISGELLGQTAFPHHNYSEGERSWQVAEEWWQNAVTAFQKLITDHDLDRQGVQGFSVSGRAGACVFMGQDGQVIAEPWSDSRHRSILVDYRSSHPATASYAATLVAKYLWMRQHQPQIAERTHRLLYAKDYLLFRLTGEAVTDPSSGPDDTGWPDDFDQSLPPRTDLPWNLAGTLTDAAAKDLGCPGGLPVAIGAHDGICANTGCNMTRDGEFALTLGTHAVCRTFSSRHQGQENRFYCYPPDRHVYGGNTWHAGSTLNWALRTLLSLPAELSQEQLADLNAAVSPQPASGELCFLPYLGGQTLPEKRPPGSGSFQGLSLEATPEMMLQSVFEGTAIAVSRTFDAVMEQAGTPTRIALTGGGIVFSSWTQMLADLLQQPLVETDHGVEGRGAAAFCAVATGHYSDVDEATTAMQPVSRLIEPGEKRDKWQPLIERFNALSQI